MWQNMSYHQYWCQIQNVHMPSMFSIIYLDVHWRTKQYCSCLWSCNLVNYDVFFYFLAILDIILIWKARRCMSTHVKLRYIFKALSAAAWVIILPITYAYSWKNPSGLAQTIRNWFGNGASSPSMFILAIFIYLSPNILSALLFLFPSIRRFLESSNNSIVKLMMWWSQVCRCICDVYLLYIYDINILPYDVTAFCLPQGIQLENVTCLDFLCQDLFNFFL